MATKEQERLDAIYCRKQSDPELDCTGNPMSDVEARYHVDQYQKFLSSIDYIYSNRGNK